MRKVILKMNEEFKYNIIKKLVDTNGNKLSASVKLNCTPRTINRLIILYNLQGKNGFIHKNSGRTPACAYDTTFKNEIIDLYINHYSDTNLVHFCEIVYKDLKVSISSNTVNYWLKTRNVLSPCATRKTKKMMKNRIESIKVNPDISIVNNCDVVVDDVDAHPRRPRSKYAGEMIQIDASQFNWIPSQTWHLHVAIDDATSIVVGAYFDTQETLSAYYNVFSQILINYGIPAMFLSDKRTVFEYKRKDTLFDNEDTFTQFSYACHQLGVNINTTSIPQAKGRVERLNRTLQSRLPIELRRANITSIEQANVFLNSYLKEYNNQFPLQLDDIKSTYELQPSIEDINLTLAILDNRVIDNGNCIKYKNSYYIPIDINSKHVYITPKTKCLVIKSFDGKIYANINDNIYALIVIDKHLLLSKEFDNPMNNQSTNEKVVYIPPMTHPWKQASFNKFLAKQKHHNFGADD